VQGILFVKFEVVIPTETLECCCKFYTVFNYNRNNSMKSPASGGASIGLVT
jgi:hypothetical protein